MDLGGDALEGVDLLRLALGREPGASDLDEFVDFQVFFDGTRLEAAAGRAAPFLRSRLCEAFGLLGADLGRYLWHRDRFVMEVELTADEPHLAGHLRTGDGVEDEWFIVHLLRRLTASLPDAACRVVDNDGELLLIESALAAPRWLSPSNAEHRVWLRGGQVHLLPRPRPPEPEKLSCREGLDRLRAADGSTLAKEKVQQAIDARLAGYPRRAFELAHHVTRVVLPLPIARLFLAYPQLVAVAADHLPTPSSRDLARCRRELPAADGAVHLDCEGFPEEETVCIGLRFTRCQFARLVGLRCQLPQRFTQKHWKAPKTGAPPERAMHLGAMMCAGLETAYLQGPLSATSVLRWPAAKLSALLPAMLPWWPDATFAQLAVSLKRPVEPTAIPARLAFLQQSELEEPFRRAFLRELRSEAIAAAVDVAGHWRDRDDPEDWLEVSTEELDREMQARQAEFEAFDRRRAGQQRPEGAGAGAGPLDEELASMGRELSGLLERASCLEGVEASDAECAGGAKRPCGGAGGGSDTDSDATGSGELDVLGLEEGEDDDDEDGEEEGDGEGDEDGQQRAGSLREYMTELDEQLEEHLDGGAPGADPADPSKTGDVSLSSHHVKVHLAEPLDLDVHAMAHVLASYCAEHHLEPGPASLLLGELGLGGGPAAAAPSRSGGGRSSSSGSSGLANFLDSMD